MGSNLGQIAMGIQLGNLDVYNFLDYAVNRECGGMIKYAIDKNNFLANNLSNNPHKGSLQFGRRYNIDEITPTGSYGIKKDSFGEPTIKDAGIHADGGQIGDVYSVEYSDNSSLKFITNDKFLAFQGHIRKIQDTGFFIRKYVQNPYSEMVSKSYTDDVTSVGLGGVVQSRKNGTLHSVEDTDRGVVSDVFSTVSSGALAFNKQINTRILTQKGRDKGYSNEKPYYVGTTKMSPYFNEHVKEREFEHLKTITEVFKEENDKNKTRILKNESFTRDYLQNITSQVGNSILPSDYFGTNTLLDTGAVKDFKSNEGIIINSNTLREPYKSPLIGINYPKSIGDFKMWSSKTTYAFDGESSDDIRVYSVGEENKFNEAIISNEFKGEKSRLLGYVKKLIEEAKLDISLSSMRSEQIYKGDGTDEYVTDRRRGGWTPQNPYKYAGDRIRPFRDLSIQETQSNYGKMRPNGVNNLTNHTVLKNDGYLRISPEHNKGEFTDVKKYMFSIENLAWKDANKSLSYEQLGPNKGRIMWFPPYNLKFSENVNVNWNENNFIGRGEGIYTYINTNRSGTLDFTLLIDHPSVVNKWRGTGDMTDETGEKEQEILDFFLGLKNLEVDDDKDGDFKNNVSNQNDNKEATTEAKPTSQTKQIVYVVFFPHMFSGIDKNINETINVLSSYNEGNNVDAKETTDKDVVYEKDEKCNGVKLTERIKKILLKTSLKIKSDAEVKPFNDLLNIDKNFENGEVFGYDSDTCSIESVDFIGFAHNNEEHTKYRGEFKKRRRQVLENILRSKSENISDSKATFNELVGSNMESRQRTNDALFNINNIAQQISRVGYVIVNVAWNKDNTANSDINSGTTSTYNGAFQDGTVSSGSSNNRNEIKQVDIKKNGYTYDNEYLYFSELHGDSLEYKRIIDKVKYFNPAYHSITPEGFNSRLTFLHQCTRQGPTNAVSGGRVTKNSNIYQKFAGNMSFGRAPYCVLRIGDFFNTKICIDSISITYDNNGVQWDLNPEGAGVQPMFANVSISFKFIGGQDISGPIERLQNAVTSNYYANASVYSRHADTKTKFYDALTDKQENKLNK